MFDGPIHQYVFEGMQSEGTDRAILIMRLPGKPYAGHVWLPWPNVPRMTDDQMTYYGRRVMCELEGRYNRGVLTGRTAVKRELKKTLGIS